MSLQARVAGLARRMTDRADNCARHIIARQPGDPLEIRRPQVAGRTSGVSRPTERAQIEWETVQQRDAARLARLLAGHPDLLDIHDTLGACEILAQLGQPLGPAVQVGQRATTVDALAAMATDGNPASVQWRAAVADLGLLWHQAAEQIHDAWTNVRADVWVTTDGGVVLDETAEADTVAWVGQIDRLARQLDHLHRRLTPARLRLCACGCGRPMEERHRGTKRPGCYQRESRQRRTA